MELLIWRNCSSSSKNRRELWRREGELKEEGPPNLLSHPVYFLRACSVLVQEFIECSSKGTHALIHPWWKKRSTSIGECFLWSHSFRGRGSIWKWREKEVLCSQSNQFNQCSDWCHRHMTPYPSSSFLETSLLPLQSQSSPEVDLEPGLRLSFFMSTFSCN